jgi:hypothetical protein
MNIVSRLVFPSKSFPEKIPMPFMAEVCGEREPEVNVTNRRRVMSLADTCFPGRCDKLPRKNFGRWTLQLP